MVLTQVRPEVRQTSQSTATVGGKDGDKYRFTVLLDGVLRYEWAPDGKFEDRPSTFAFQRDQKTVPHYKLRDSEDGLEITTSRFHLAYNKQEFSSHGLFAVVLGHTDHTWRFGEEGRTLGGTYRTLDGVNGRVDVDPGVTSRDGFAHIDDSASFVFTDDGWIAARPKEEGRIDGYLFAYGHDYREAVRALFMISGPQPLLPRFMLGNWWSRYYAYTADSYLELLDNFEKNRIPLSVGVVDMDWHLVDDPRIPEAGVSGWTGYTWNRKLFSNPPAFIKELHRRKLKTSLNEHPAEGVANYEDMYKAMGNALGFDTSNGDTIRFDCTDRAYMNAYFKVLLRSLEDDGVDFWWIDWQQGQYSKLPGVDPLWMLNHYHFLHNAELQADRPVSQGGGSRPIIFSRYGGPGSQRYPVGFSGDTFISWASLNFQPEFTATASNIGYGWWSHDIGGHQQGLRDDDLTSRWVQLGVFSPIMRLHSSKTRWVCKEPWKLPAGSGQGPRDVVTKFLRLRHRLLPYLHTMNARAAEEGYPLIEPMYWAYPERDEAYKVPNQYYFGTEMIVAPITAPQHRPTKTGRVKAWLPPGRYVDFFTGVVYDGDRYMWLNRTLDKMPILLKQGAIVPLDVNEKPENGVDSPGGFEVVVVVGDDGKFEILEEDDDDEKSKSPKQDVKWLRTPVSFTQKTGTVEIGPSSQGLSPKARVWTVRFVGYKSADALRIQVDQQSITPATALVDNGLVVKVGRVQPGSNIRISIGSNPQLSVNDPMALADPIVFDAEVEYNSKERYDDIMKRTDTSASTKASQVDAADMDDEMRYILKEFLLADCRV